jgi:hypothetical protein
MKRVVCGLGDTLAISFLRAFHSRWHFIHKPLQSISFVELCWQDEEEQDGSN